MNGIVLLDDYVEELDLSVRAYKTLRKHGISQVRDILGYTMEEVYKLLLDGSWKCFGEVVVTLNRYGFRLKDCGYDLYPDIEKSLPEIISGFWKNRKAKKTTRSVEHKDRAPASNQNNTSGNGISKFPLELVQSFTTISSMINPGHPEGLFIATADNSGNFTDYGIREGSILVFDSEMECQESFPCCYMNKQSKKIKILRNARTNYKYIGKLVAVVNTSWPEAV